MKLISRKKRLGTTEKIKNVLTNDSKFAIVEGYKSARTSIVFSIVAEENPCVAVTSWSKGEGKSTATVNLAISFAKMGKKVLLIDTDLRRPNVHNLLKLKNTPGLSEIIGKFANFDDVVYTDVVPSLDVVTSGAVPPNPSELIASTAFSAFMDKVKNEYDYVILDTPPVGVVTDALLLKDHIAGYVMIVREKITTHGDIEKAVQAVELAGNKILGFLKVGCSLQDRKKYKNGNYGYYKYY